MSNTLMIPETFEDMTEEISGDQDLLTQIIQPVVEAEEAISITLKAIKNTGFLTFLEGKSGSGKSTFLASLEWRKHIQSSRIFSINASDFVDDGNLKQLFKEIKRIAQKAKAVKDLGPAIIILDYLENLDDMDESEATGFFRNINALLRTHPILIIWPSISTTAIDKMASIALEISSTLFHKNKVKIPFNGPSEEAYIDIAKRTINVINKGKEPAEFGLTNDTFEHVKSTFDKLPKSARTIRKYLQLIKEEWESSSGHCEKIRESIPKPIEVWFVFAYPEAEKTVQLFTRKGQSIEESWTPIHDKFYEYIPGTQRSAKWNPSRLQLALFGYIKTRIMFIPTNAIISTVYAYGESDRVKSEFDKISIPANWKTKSGAKSHISTTTVCKQLNGIKYHVGFRRGGPAANAINIAKPLFTKLNQLITRGGISDIVINKAFSEALIANGVQNVAHQIPHPWLKNITPDITVKQNDRTVSIEFHYTDDPSAHIIANYVLGKLDTYIEQIEELSSKKKAKTK